MADEKTSFGATIVEQPSTTPHSELPPLLTTTHLPTVSEVDSVASRTTTPKEDLDPSNPFSAFYSHPDLRRSTEKDRLAPSKSNSHLNVDLEAGSPISTTTTIQQHKYSVDGRVKECTMWPSRQTLQEKARARKAARGGCNPMRNLSKKQKLWVKIFIAMFVVAAAVGLGIGISKAVGGGVWAGKGESRQIPDTRKR